MSRWGQGLAAMVLTLGISLGFAKTADAEAPEIYSAWQGLAISPEQCVNRATDAFNTLDLADLETTTSSVMANAEDATAMFLCVGEAEDSNTTVVIVVSSIDNDAAVRLREALKDAF